MKNGLTLPHAHTHKYTHTSRHTELKGNHFSVDKRNKSSSSAVYFKQQERQIISESDQNQQNKENAESKRANDENDHSKISSHWKVQPVQLVQYPNDSHLD